MGPANLPVSSSWSFILAFTFSSAVCSRKQHKTLRINGNDNHKDAHKTRTGKIQNPESINKERTPQEWLYQMGVHGFILKHVKDFKRNNANPILKMM